MIQPNYNNKEISAVEVYNFIRRHSTAIFAVFTICYGIVIASLLSLPTIYMASIQIAIGNDSFFTNNKHPIEPPEQTKHRFSNSDVQIEPIKNTNLLNITARQKSLKDASDKVTIVANEIIKDHQSLREEKTKNFKMLIADSLHNHTTFLDTIDSASSATPTRVTRSLDAKSIPYKGLLYKGLAIGFLASSALALLVAATMEALAKYKQGAISNPPPGYE